MWEISTFYSIKTIYIYIYIYTHIHNVIRGKYWSERIWIHCYHHFFIGNSLHTQKFMKQSQFHLWFPSLFKFWWNYLMQLIKYTVKFYFSLLFFVYTLQQTFYLRCASSKCYIFVFTDLRLDLWIQTWRWRGERIHHHFHHWSKTNT